MRDEKIAKVLFLLNFRRHKLSGYRAEDFLPRPVSGWHARRSGSRPGRNITETADRINRSDERIQPNRVAQQAQWAGELRSLGKTNRKKTTTAMRTIKVGRNMKINRRMLRPRPILDGTMRRVMAAKQSWCCMV